VQEVHPIIILSQLIQTPEKFAKLSKQVMQFKLSEQSTQPTAQGKQENGG
jgi:hypothetical protein